MRSPLGLLLLTASFVAGWMLRPPIRQPDTPGKTTAVRETRAAGVTAGADKNHSDPAAANERSERLVRGMKEWLTELDNAGVDRVEFETSECGTTSPRWMRLRSLAAVLPLMNVDAATLRETVLLLDHRLESAGRYGDEMIQHLMERWMMLDPEEALRCKLLHFSGNDWEIPSIALAKIARTDPARAQKLVSLAPEHFRPWLLRLLERIADPPSLTQWLENPSDAGYGGLSRLTERAMTNDPDGTLAWLARQPTGTVERSILWTIAKTQVMQAPDRIFLWVDSLPPWQKTTAMESVFYFRGLDWTDEASWAEFLSGLPPDWQDMAQLRKMEQSSQSPAQMERKLAAILARHPEYADTAALRCSDVILGQWTENEQYGEAVRWSLTLPEGQTQDFVFKILSRDLAEFPELAVQWASQLSAGPSREIALEKLSYGAEDPALRLAFAAALADPAERERVSRARYRDWLENDPLAAIPALEALTPEERERMLAPEEP